MARIIVSLDASADLDEIRLYLTLQAGPAVARRYNREFKTAIRMLADFPQSMQLRPELGSDIRIAILKQYVILHRHDVAENTVTILRILHGRREITPHQPGNG